MREILISHECAAIASKTGLGGLYECAQHMHVELSAQRGDEVINMDQSDLPTSAMGFYFNQAAGECGVLVATVGASREENGMEGTRFLFNPYEAKQALAALLAELSQYDEQPAEQPGSHRNQDELGTA